jgi:hypothetical protein
MDDFDKLIESTSTAIDQPEAAPAPEPARYPPSATGVSPQGLAPNIQAQQLQRPTRPPDTGPSIAPAPADSPSVSIAPGTAFDPAAFTRDIESTSAGGEGFLGGLKQIGYGMSEAAADTGLPFMGALAGVVRGAPAGVPGMLIGGGTGLLAGYLTGQGLKPMIPQARPEDLPLRIMGQTISESMAIAPTAFFLPVQTGGRVATLVSKIGESARKSPAGYLSAEALTSIGAGAGAGIAEGLDPGAAGTRLVGSLLGGAAFSIPASILQNTITSAGPVLRTIADAANPVPLFAAPGQRLGEVWDNTLEALRTRQYTRAANTLYDLLEEHKEDVPALIRALEDPGIEGIPMMTAAQKTGNKTLAGLEARLALGGKDRYKPETLEQGKLAFEALRVLTRRLSEVGDPEALRLAAQLRETAFNQMLQNRLTAAEADAAAQIARIPRVDVAGRRQLGDIVKSEVELALQHARMVEGELWRAGLLQVLRSGSGAPAVSEEAFQAALKKAKMTPKEYESISDVVTRFPDLRTDAVKTRDDWRAHFNSYLQLPEAQLERMVKNRYEGSELYRRFLELERLKGAAPSAAGTADVVPSSAAQNFLERTKDTSPENFEMLPAPLRNIMQGLGININVWNNYKNGTRTIEALETGNVPQQFMPQLRAVNAVDLLSNRSELMKLARSARAANDNDLAGIYNDVAAGLLDDIGTLNAPMLDEARAFSRALNDVFTRTYANDVTAMTARGAERLTPEMLVRRAFSPSNMDQTTARMEEIRGSLSFPRQQYEDALTRLGPDHEITQGLRPLAEMAGTQLATVNGAFQSVLLTAAAKTMRQEMDPATGRMVTQVNPTALTNFVTENRQLLDSLGLTDTLSNAVRAQNAFDLVRMENSAMNKGLREQTAFAKVLAGGENPIVAVADVLNSKHAVRDFGKLVKLAKAGGPEAMNGLKSSVYEYAYQAAGGSKSFSPQKYLEVLYGRSAGEPGPTFRQPSVMNIMRQNGVITLTEQKNMQRLIAPMIRIQQGIDSNVPVEEFIRGVGALEDLALRVLGSNIGTAAAGSGPGSLIAASAGSKYLRQIFDQVPTLELRRMIEKASQDPEFMAVLLRQGRTNRERYEIARKLNSYMISSGVTAFSSIFDEPPPEPEPFSQSQSSRMFRQLPPAPSTRGTPGLPQGGGQPAPGPQSQAPATQSRAMLQQLFPFDSISAMAAQPAPPPQ